MKRIRTQNWLTIAVAKRMVVMCALVLGMTACSNEDNVPGEIPGRTNIIDLSGVVSDLTITNGMTLTGKLTRFHNIRIAAGATVTLSGVRIPGRDITDDDQLWTHAGITCLGDATIVLADSTTNYVKGFGSSYPGIQAGPKGTMLASEADRTRRWAISPLRTAPSQLRLALVPQVSDPDMHTRMAQPLVATSASSTLPSKLMAAMVQHASEAAGIMATKTLVATYTSLTASSWTRATSPTSTTSVQAMAARWATSLSATMILK